MESRMAEVLATMAEERILESDPPSCSVELSICGFS